VDENTEMQPGSTAVVDPSARSERPRRPRGVAVAGALGALGVATAVLVGVGTSGAATTSATSHGTTAQTGPTFSLGHGSGGYGLPYGGGSATRGLGGSAGSSTVPTAATDDQQIGVVDIDTVLGYQGGEAAGTGMVLTTGGEILTNNHVVQGATSIRVTVVSTGATYPATVVGTDPTDDVAVLQLSDASGLQVADLSDQAADIGDAVTAVGNAGGTGGTPSAVSGTVTALQQTITATDESGGNSETLDGLIQTDADVQPGDSGGPLYDTASGEIVGMDTAASSGGDVVGYAIPISDALAVAGQISDGIDNATVHQGYPAFLGVSVAPSGTVGAAVAGVLSGGPADQAGLAAGDVITAVGGTAIHSADDLSSAMAGHDPGDTVPVTWTDAAGSTHTAQVTLADGPAD
jgi:S1-C subfamily serine protease